MDIKNLLGPDSGKISFRGLLFLVAVLYIGVYFLTGDLLTQLPTNWFTNWFSEVFSLMDEHGFFNVWSGQNPGTHYLYFLLWKPAQFISGGEWYLTGVFSLLWYFTSIAALFLSVYFFYKIVERIAGEQKAIILGLVYIIIFLTFTWFTVIDSISIATLLGAIHYCFKGNVKLGGVLLGLGALIKPFGLLLLPIIFKSEFLSLKAKISFAIASIATFGLLMLPFAIGNFKIFISAFNWQSGRPPWETVYAFGLWLSGTPVANDPFFQDYSGITQRDWGWTGITPVHSMMTTAVPDFNQWYSTVFVILMVIVVLGFFLFKRIRFESDLIWGGLFILSAYFVVFYGWSHNFYFWLVPFLLISFPVSVSVFFRLVILFEYPLFYGLYLAHIAPDLVTSVSGLPASVTSTLSPIGVLFWAVIVFKTIILFTFARTSWKKLETHSLITEWQHYLKDYRKRRT